MLLSIIVPCYNEGESIKYTYQEIKKVLNNINIQHEIVFINDGSKDNTLQILKNIGQNDKSVKYISFSRNFGKEAGMLAGLEYITGDCVVIMDADLQHPPELIPEMIKYYEEGYDQVIAKRNRKGDNKYRTWATKLYYKLVNKLIDVELVDGVGDFRLLSRKAVDSILAMKEYNRFSKGIFSWIGFKQKTIQYENQSRVAGETKWSFKSLLSYGIDGIISFNDKPLRVCFVIGCSLIIMSLIYIVFLLVQILISGIDVPGYFTTIASIMIIGGVQLVFIGVLGEYIGKIYYEVKKRPHFIVDESNINNAAGDIYDDYYEEVALSKDTNE
ncbi:glycosyltransferase family 2 protein [Intestinibacter bartlettii]|uniref:glycosyltransferase family 2 protein n=1 Tax=Intestinibacter bartlettii TaxID=261299 RepID=UPI00319E6AD0